MDKAIVLASLTSALTLIATEAIKGVASSASKDLWTKVKTVFGWNTDPPVSQLPAEIARRLQADQELASRLAELIVTSLPSNETAAMVVSNLTAEKAVIGSNINIGGDLKM